MLHQCHLGHESAASISSCLALRPVSKTWVSGGFEFCRKATTSFDIQIIIAQRDVDLVEHDHAQIRIADQFLAFSQPAWAAAMSRRGPASQVKPSPMAVELAQLTECVVRSRRSPVSRRP